MTNTTNRQSGRVFFANLRGRDGSGTQLSSDVDHIRRETRDFGFLDGLDGPVDYLFPDGIDLDVTDLGESTFQFRSTIARKNGRPDASTSIVSFDRNCLSPLLHGCPWDCDIRLDDWWSYRRLNRFAARELSGMSEPLPGGVTVVASPLLIHLAKDLTESGMQIPAGFLFDTPFPKAEDFRYFPWQDELVRAFRAYDAIGFLSRADLDRFRDWMLEAEPAALFEESQDVLWWNGSDGAPRQRLLVVPPHAPAYIPAKAVDVRTAGKRQHARVIVAVDPLIEHRSIPRTLLGFERMLESFPETLGAITLEQIIAPSDILESIDSELRLLVQTLVSRINRRFGTEDWHPVRFRHARDFEDILDNIGQADALVCFSNGASDLGRVAFAWSQRDRHLPALIDERYLGESQRKHVDLDDVDILARGFLEAVALKPDQRREQYLEFLTSLGENTADGNFRDFIDVLQGHRRDRKTSGEDTLGSEFRPTRKSP